MTFYEMRLEEAEAVLAELVERSQSADGEEFERMVEEITAAQTEVNNWKRAV